MEHSGCQAAMSETQKLEAIVWRGDLSLQGFKVLKVPVGHPSFIAAEAKVS